MKLFEVLVGLVLLVHLLWILWVILGWLVTRSRLLLRWSHVSSRLWGILIEVRPWPCPLTIAEQRLQGRAGSAPYEGSFLNHYLEFLIYPDVSTGALTWAGSGVCLLILAIHSRRFWQERACTLGMAR